MKGGEKLNLALNLFLTKAGLSQTATNTSSSGNSKSESKTSFSNVLNNAVSQTDEVTVKAEKITAGNLMNAVLNNGFKEKNTVANDQTSADSNESSEDDTNQSEENALFTQDVSMNLINPVLTTQISFAMAEANPPVVNTQSMVSSEQVTTAIAVQGIQTPALQVETTLTVNGTALAQAATGLQIQGLQKGTTPTVNATILPQTATDLPTQALQKETTPTVNDTILSQAATGLQTQELQRETTPTVNGTILSQAATDLQIQTLQIDATTNGIGTILPQTAIDTQQTQAMQVEAMPTVNSIILAQAAPGLQTQALQIDATATGTGTILPQTATDIQQTQAMRVEAMPTVNSTILAQAATDLQTQASQKETTPTVNGTVLAQAAPGLQTALQKETTPTVNGTILAQAATGIQTQALQIDATATGNGTILPQTATNIQQTQAMQVEAMPTVNSIILPQAATGLQAQAVKVEATQDANGKANKQVQQTGEQIAIPTVGTNQQDKALRSDLSGEGQKDNLTDTSTFNGTQVLSSESNEAMNFSVFAQNLDAALVSTNGLTVSAKTTETQSQTTPSADVYQVLDQIVEQTKIITKPQNTEMIMKLKPEHLGELTLKIAIENGVVNASFHSNNPEVRTLIEASLPQLKQELASTGIKVDNVSVYAGLSQFQPNQDQSQNSHQQLMKFTNKKSADDFIEAIDGESAGGNTSGMGLQSGVDYRI